MKKIMDRIKKKIDPNNGNVKQMIEKVQESQKGVDEIIRNLEEATSNGDELSCTIHRKPKSPNFGFI